MNKMLIFNVVLLACFCAATESGIITIEFPDEDYVPKLLNGTLELLTNHTFFNIKTPQSSSLLQNFGPVHIVNGGKARVEETSGDQSSRDQLLVKGSKRLQDWLSSSNLEHTTTIHLFNVTNTKQLYGKSVQLVGPFKFRQDRTYTVEKFTDDERYVVVKQSKKYHLTDKSSHELEKPITILNAPLIALYEAILRLDTRGKNYGTDKSTLIDEMFEKLPLFVTVKVGELLFGYRDATLEMISKVEENFRANGLKLVLPDSIQNGRYSVMGAMNSTEPLLKVNTGKENIRALGQIAGMNGFDSNPAWGNFSDFNCQEFTGSDGMIRGPLSEEDSSIKLFIPEMDRPVELEKVSFDGTVDNGQRVSKYQWSSNNFKSSANYPPNTCYHKYGWLVYEDVDGIMTKSRNTSKNEQLVFSQPLFLGDGKKNRRYFEALVPNEKLHDSFIEIAEETGETIRERRSLQINVDTGLINDRITRLFFPMYYFTDESTVDLDRYDSA